MASEVTGQFFQVAFNMIVALASVSSELLHSSGGALCCVPQAERGNIECITWFDQCVSN